jgi:hypothetical protein
MGNAGGGPDEWALLSLVIHISNKTIVETSSMPNINSFDSSIVKHF